jgi:two-component system, cell cycle sensor histidine kinase and response regulator CckA
MDSAAAARILLVDDEPSLVRMMATYLTRMGYEVASFTSTDKAWAQAQAGEPFALAVLDLTMPGLSAQELGARLLDWNPQIRIIGASGYPTGFEGLRAAAPDRTVFLHKPFTPSALAGLVRQMLA